MTCRLYVGVSDNKDALDDHTDTKDSWQARARRRMECCKLRLQRFALTMPDEMPDDLLDYLDPFLPPSFKSLNQQIQASMSHLDKPTDPTATSDSDTEPDGITDHHEEDDELDSEGSAASLSAGGQPQAESSPDLSRLLADATAKLQQLGSTGVNSNYPDVTLGMEGVHQLLAQMQTEDSVLDSRLEASKAITDRCQKAVHHQPGLLSPGELTVVADTDSGDSGSSCSSTQAVCLVEKNTADTRKAAVTPAPTSSKHSAASSTEQGCSGSKKTGNFNNNVVSKAADNCCMVPAPDTCIQCESALPTAASSATAAEQSATAAIPSATAAMPSATAAMPSATAATSSAITAVPSGTAAGQSATAAIPSANATSPTANTPGKPASKTAPVVVASAAKPAAASANVPGKPARGQRSTALSRVKAKT